MNLQDDESKEAQRLVAKLKTKTEFTKSFDEWDESARKLLSAHLSMDAGEIPVLAHLRSTSHWMVVSTRRVVWRNPDERVRMLFMRDIAEVSQSLGPVDWNDPELEIQPYGADVQWSACNKPWLCISDFDGNDFMILLDSGPHISNVRNIIWQSCKGWTQAAVVATKLNELSSLKSIKLKSDEHIVLRIEQHILSHSSETELRLFRKLPSNVRMFLLSRVQLEKGELPICVLYKNNDSWLQFSTRRMFWCNEAGVKNLSYKQISKMGQTEMRNLDRLSDWEEKKREAHRVKVHSPHFFIVDTHGSEHHLLLPPGTTLFDIWNVILKLMHMSR